MSSKMILLLMILSISAAAKDYSAASRLRAGEIVPTSQVLTTLNRTRPGQLRDIALQHKGDHEAYQVAWQDTQCETWHVDYDATTGLPERLHKDKSP